MRFRVLGLGVAGTVILATSTVVAGTGWSPSPNGVVVGKAIDAVTHQPVGSATVSLLREDDSREASVNADNDGRFVFSALPAGRWYLVGTQPGYARSYYGARAPNAARQPIDLAADEKVSDLVISMWKNAVVAGRVTDAAGDPIVGAQVIAARLIAAGGRPHLQSDRFGKTDDRGDYRLADLVTGQYAIVLMSPSAASPTSTGYSPSGFPTLFYPDATSSAGAVTLALRSADDRSGLDFHVASYATYSVSGTVTGLDLSRAGRQIATLRHTDPAGIRQEFDTRSAPVTGEGAFTFAGVLPGEYVVEVVQAPAHEAPSDGPFMDLWVNPAAAVRLNDTDMVDLLGRFRGLFGSTSAFGVAAPPPLTPAPLAPAMWASVAVSVMTKNVDAVAVALEPAASLGGRVVFEGAAPKPTAEVFRSTPVVVTAADGHAFNRTETAGLNADGSFRTASFLPGWYQLTIAGRFPGWSVASITRGGHDILPASIELGATNITDLVLTYTDRPAQLSGVVRNGDGQSVPDATIYLFPADRRSWTSAPMWSGAALEIRPSRNGTFKTPALPGEYYLAAITSEPRDDWQLADVLEQLAKSAITVTIAPGEHVIKDLKVR